MTYSEETRQTIIRMKEAGATFRIIGLAINKSREAVKKWWQRNHIDMIRIRLVEETIITKIKLISTVTSEILPQNVEFAQECKTR